MTLINVYEMDWNQQACNVCLQSVFIKPANSKLCTPIFEDLIESYSPDFNFICLLWDLATACWFILCLSWVASLYK